MTGLGWKSVGVLELTALPSIGKERWVSWVRESDVLLVNGGDTLYLCHWMRESGLADLFPSLRDTVYVGLSAGSMVLTPRIGEHFASRNPRADGDDSTLGLVDFSIFPHLDSPDRTMAEAEQWAAGIKGPAYAIDSQTAIKVTDGSAEVISEGYWKLFNAAVSRAATLLSRAKSLPRPSQLRMIAVASATAEVWWRPPFSMRKSGWPSGAVSSWTWPGPCSSPMK
jgi:dipeptidase E